MPEAVRTAVVHESPTAGCYQRLLTPHSAWGLPADRRVWHPRPDSATCRRLSGNELVPVIADPSENDWLLSDGRSGKQTFAGIVMSGWRPLGKVI